MATCPVLDADVIGARIAEPKGGGVSRWIASGGNSGDAVYGCIVCNGPLGVCRDCDFPSAASGVRRGTAVWIKATYCRCRATRTHDTMNLEVHKYPLGREGREELSSTPIFERS